MNTVAPTLFHYTTLPAWQDIQADGAIRTFADRFDRVDHPFDHLVWLTDLPDATHADLMADWCHPRPWGFGVRITVVPDRRRLRRWVDVAHAVADNPADLAHFHAGTRPEHWWTHAASIRRWTEVRITADDETP